jgi:hypothetical protein
MRARPLKNSASILFSVTIFFASASLVCAWGDAGHQTVGQIAALRIKPRTAKKLAQILQSGETLASIATWADSVKDRVGQTDPDADTNEFLQDVVHNQKNREWHYDDLPLGCQNYQTCTGFTPDNDIVHMLNVCIRTLQGQPDPAHPLSRRNALKLLVHFLGDLHQPLHVGCGFIEQRADGTFFIATDPVAIKRNNPPSDRGGNQLIINRDRRNLHSFWDFDLVTSLMQTTDKQTSELLGEFLRKSVPPEVNWKPHGPLNTWAAQWATDALRQSREQTYKSIQITGRRTITVQTRDGKPLLKDGQPVTEVVYDVTRADNYEALNREVVREQLAKGGYRLARLLDAIFAK